MGKLIVDKDDITVYEIGYLILPSIPEDSLAQVTDAIRALISTKGATEISAEEPFKEALAYPISKTVGASSYVLTEAYIGWIKFEVERARITEISEELKGINEIIRFLLIKVPRETTFTFAKAREAIEVPIPSGDEIPMADVEPVAEKIIVI